MLDYSKHPQIKDTVVFRTQIQNIRTCLAKQNQAGSYTWSPIKYDKQFNQLVWDCKATYKKILSWTVITK